MNDRFRFFAVSLLAGILSGCATGFDAGDPPEQIEIVCCRPGEIRIDGRMDEPAWEQAVRYELRTPVPSGNPGNHPVQPGRVRFVCDSRSLYVAAEFADDDIVQYGHDNEDLCKRGDLLELFIRGPSGCYWEIHLAPTGRCAVIFYPNAGRRIFPEAIRKSSPVRCAGNIDGTLNEYRDTDRGFCIEAAVPLSLFREEKAVFGAGWTLLAARYNYSKSFERIEYSASVVLPEIDYHAVRYHTPVKITR